MATITGSMAGVLRRPTSHAGVWGWMTTVDHKRIGVLYGVTSFIFFLIGGIEALMLRLQLAFPDGKLVDPEVFNQLFTMHATTMVFLVIMPLSAAFFNFLVPLQIGARDVAFPRLNAFSYWGFVAGGVFINSSFLFGGAPNAGWFGYANLTSRAFNAGSGVDFWALGLIGLGTASLAASFNFIVTILNMRAPGMTMMRMPLFTWMTLVVAFLLIFAMPIIAVALIQLELDRSPLATNFFNPANGGDPILWQHLFWLFGHPEVYILILPAMGIVSEVLPTFARKPLFGYPAVVFAGVFIGFMGWGVWAHHMFTVGLGPVANSVFAVTTMFIAVPTGIKIFNWIATLWGGSLKFTTAMLFSIGFISMFIIGGLSGVTHASPPADYQQQDTYYIVAHFHYVLFGGSILALFSGFYFWWPKGTGKLLDEGLGKLNFWLMIIGMNLTFGPMHILGLNGMPRRIYTYPAGMGWEFWNLIETAGSLLIALSVLVFIINVVRTSRNGKEAGPDPWDGRTLEWSIPSPPPEYNFATVPVVQGRDAFWIEKYGFHGGEGAHHAAPPSHSAGPGHGDGHAIHMPQGSYLPMVAAFGQTLMLAGVIFGYWLSAVGLVIMLGGVYAWCSEPVSD
ncbi:MAG: cytochrome c oxidase subunit I [Chloroflexota bacterium]